MSPELKHLTEEKFSDFLKTSYPVKQEEVDAVIEAAQKRQTKFVSAGSLIMSDAGFEVERGGIDKVPAMLAAIVKLGTEVSQETYARLLARGEIRTSQLMLDKRNYGEASVHAQKAVVLTGFLSGFQK